MKHDHSELTGARVGLLITFGVPMLCIVFGALVAVLL